MHPGKQKAHKITTVIKKKGLWNIRLEKQEMQVSFSFKKKKQKKTSQITNYSIFVKPALTNATN